MKNKSIQLLILSSLAFFLVLFLSIPSYGISWDEPIHFHRGQAYLHYFLTGRQDFQGLPDSPEKFPTYGQLLTSPSGDTQRSYYQNETLDTEYFLVNDGGHPPINGIIAALTNFIFYQQLSILGDIESHQLFIIITSTLLVLVVSLFAYQTYGLFSAIVAFLSLVLYPLFFAESHFNIKDPPETFFITLTIWAFWNSLRKKDWRWLLLSILSFALAFGTKFNALFLPLMVMPYLLVCYAKLILNPKKLFISIKNIPIKYLLLLITAPVIVLGIFYLSWPYLWQDPINNFLSITNYYKEIGTESGGSAENYLATNFNLYPLYWIYATTPPFTLFLTLIGSITALVQLKKGHKVGILWLGWLLIPILRVSMPYASIYGGIRQIFEFIPAMALLSGLGAVGIINLLKLKANNKLVPAAATILILVLFLPNLYVLIKLHPNQNVYFNSLVGGLPGAAKAQIPYWGNSFGNAYWQVLQWLNQNAEPNSKIALVQGTGLNIPDSMIRKDIRFSNGFWSGINRQGEYLFELTHDDPVKLYPYAWDYIGRFLEPAYEVKVDGVAIAKIWKNDLDHTYPAMRKSEEVIPARVTSSPEQKMLLIDLQKSQILTRLEVSFNQNDDCQTPKGLIQLSEDGELWVDQADPVPYPQITGAESLQFGKMGYFFAASQARFIRLTVETERSCIFSQPIVTVKALQ